LSFQCSSASFESAILGEAHGLITDMLADASMPPNVVSGLRTLSNLLKPPENHSSFHKPRVSPLVSLTESTNYGSDNEESPYTGERPSMLPKVRVCQNPCLEKRRKMKLDILQYFTSTSIQKNRIFMNSAEHIF